MPHQSPLQTTINGTILPLASSELRAHVRIGLELSINAAILPLASPELRVHVGIGLELSINTAILPLASAQFIGNCVSDGISYDHSIDSYKAGVLKRLRSGEILADEEN